MADSGYYLKAGGACSHRATEAVIELLGDANNMGWDSITSHDLPEAIPVDAVKSLLKVNEVYVELPLPFTALLNDVPESEDLVDTSLSFSETCLFVAEYFVNC